MRAIRFMQKTGVRSAIRKIICLEDSPHRRAYSPDRVVEAVKKVKMEGISESVRDARNRRYYVL